MAGTSLEIKKDHTLGFAKTGHAADSLVGAGLLQAKDVGQREPKCRRTADAQNIAAGYSVTGVLSRTSWNHKHGRHLKNERTWRVAFKVGIRTAACLLY